jgi:hypothetical protein
LVNVNKTAVTLAGVTADGATSLLLRLIP